MLAIAGSIASGRWPQLPENQLKQMSSRAASHAAKRPETLAGHHIVREHVVEITVVVDEALRVLGHVAACLRCLRQ